MVGPPSGDMIEVVRSGPDGVLFRGRGYLTTALTPFVRKTVAPILAKGSRVHVFFDIAEVDSYESAARTTMTEWIKEVRPSLAGLHVLLRSRLVAMGVAVANVALGGFVTAYTDERKFYSEVDALLPK